jgi:hypothetical protein
MCVWESSIFFENSKKKKDGFGQVMILGASVQLEVS